MGDIPKIEKTRHGILENETSVGAKHFTFQNALHSSAEEIFCCIRHPINTLGNFCRCFTREGAREQERATMHCNIVANMILER